MSIPFYTILHVVSLMTALITLGAVISHLLQGGSKENFKARKGIAALHGIAVLIAFISGFALMGKSGYSFSNAPWLYIKIACWIILGVFPTLVYKRVLPPWASLVFLIGTIATAVTVVTYKPF